MSYIDLHTHGLAGIDTRSEEPDDYLRLAASMKEYGTGAFLPTLFPGPVDEMRAVMRAIRRAIEMQGGDINPSKPPLAKGGDGGFGSSSPLGGEGGGGGAINHPPLYPLPKREGVGGGGAAILGVHLEGPFVNPEKCGALDRGAFLPATVDNFDRLLDGFEGIVKIITVAPELPGALKLIERAVSLGIRVNMGHSEAKFDEARQGAHAGATGVTHLFNAMSGLHHREPGLAAYALSDDSLYVEVIADMAHVHPEMLRLCLRLKKPGRVILVSDSLGQAKAAGAARGAPLYMPDGRTLAGSGITVAEAVENVKALGVTGYAAVSFATVNPASYLEGTALENL